MAGPSGLPVNPPRAGAPSDDLVLLQLPVVALLSLTSGSQAKVAAVGAQKPVTLVSKRLGKRQTNVRGTRAPPILGIATGRKRLEDCPRD